MRVFANQPIYVETLIHTDMESIWEATQNPQKHVEWDLRFSQIDYIPKQEEEEKQRFRYVTNIGFGLRIEGEGVTTSGKHQDHKRMSSLHFSSDQAISLILSGGGYWRYEQADKGIRFLTRYDYKTRFYFLGKWFDFFVFRPLMGWATALSFDVLKIWLEKGISPKISYRQLFIHAIVTFGLMFTWIYHGLVPKLLTQDAQELALLKGIIGSEANAVLLLQVVGLLEIAVGILCLLFHRRKALYIFNIAAMLLLAIGAAISDISVFLAPFNPATLNMAVCLLAWIGCMTLAHLPSAKHCIRKQL
ncbi:DoxX-like family protein [Paenibacillus sp. 453mf]|uniref:DoxX-like family protein n=1 Tax=Paenibacillus sp. 453mf TaxID=1761874 RepID=UPI0008EDA880|nr:DoxX-like family protein [Paenibacillus sp. 453mf]SFS61901.1 DoxX-like family protein [Paenibacillus sp. 453mf]